MLNEYELEEAPADIGARYEIEQESFDKFLIYDSFLGDYVARFDNVFDAKQFIRESE